LTLNKFLQTISQFYVNRDMTLIDAVTKGKSGILS